MSVIPPPGPAWGRAPQRRPFPQRPALQTPAGNEASKQQTCAQGKNLTKYVVSDSSWAVVPFDKGTRFPTFGYETATVGAPLVLEVDTAAGAGPGGAGVVLTYTRANSGMGNTTVT